MGVKIEVDFYTIFVSIFHRFYLPKTIENESPKRRETYPKVVPNPKLFLKHFDAKNECKNNFTKESQHPRNTVKTNTKTTFSKNTQSKKLTKIEHKTHYNTLQKH